MIVIKIIERLDFDGQAADKNRFSFDEFVIIMQALNAPSNETPASINNSQ
jgi:hypothetical protein